MDSYLKLNSFDCENEGMEEVSMQAEEKGKTRQSGFNLGHTDFETIIRNSQVIFRKIYILL